MRISIIFLCCIILLLQLLTIQCFILFVPRLFRSFLLSHRDDMLNRNINLGLEDILSEDDMKSAMNRFKSLQETFPKINRKDMSSIVTTSPLLLTMEIEKFNQAIKSLSSAYPNIDMNYLLQQRSPGLELLLLTMSKNFNYSQNQIEISNILCDSKRNTTELIERIPYVLIPKYFMQLKSQIYSLKQHFSDFCDDSTAVSIIEKWPRILTLDLENSLKQLNNSLIHRENISLKPKEFFLMISTSPQSLLVSSTLTKVAYLRKSYPNWNISKVIVKYPKILIWNTTTLANHYKKLQVGLGDLCDIDLVINSFPRVLGYNSMILREKLISIQSYFPSVASSIILEKYPQCIISYDCDDIISRVKKVNKIFLNSQAAGGLDEVDYRLRVDTSTTSKSKIPIHPSFPKFTEETILSKEDAIRIARELEVVFEQEEKGIYYDTSIEEIKSLYDDSSIQADKTPQVPISYTLEEEYQPSVDQKSSFDVSRIIFGNMNIFLEKFPYFMKLINIWIEALDPAMTYVVLNAVPTVLTKKPHTLRPILKFSYGEIALKRFTYSITDKSIVESRVSIFGPMNTVSNLGRVHLALQSMLMESPKILRLTIPELKSRIEKLHTEVFYVNQSLNSSLRSIPVLSSSRLLTESPFQRILTRFEKLNSFQAMKYIHDELSSHPICYEFPQLLIQPLSIIFSRIPFIVEYIRHFEKSSRYSLSFQECVGFIFLNTDDFLYQLQIYLKQRSIEQDLMTISRDYMSHLQSIHRNYDNQAIFDNAHDSECKLCGILNTLYSN